MRDYANIYLGFFQVVQWFCGKGLESNTLIFEPVKDHVPEFSVQTPDPHLLEKCGPKF
jgi:hypothetical protein